MEKNKRIALENELLSKLDLDVLPSGGYLTSDKAITYLFEDKKDGFFWGKTSYFDNYVSVDFFDFIGCNKDVIIDFSIEHPEVSYELLYWLAMTKICKPKDFKGYTQEQINQIPRVIREVIVNPADKYKLHISQLVTDETLYYSITDDNMWSALEWVAANHPQKLNSFIGKNTPASPYSRKTVLEHYKGVEDKSTLPDALQRFLIIVQKQHDAQVERQKAQAEKRRQQAREKLMNWYDADGNLLKLFGLQDGMEIKTLDDYKLILSYFVSSKLSAQDFCNHYLIDNVDGFKLMCKKFAVTNPEFETYYANLSSQTQQPINMLPQIEPEAKVDREVVARESTISAQTKEDEIASVSISENKLMNLSKVYKPFDKNKNIELGTNFVDQFKPFEKTEAISTHQPEETTNLSYIQTPKKYRLSVSVIDFFKALANRVIQNNESLQDYFSFTKTQSKESSELSSTSEQIKTYA